MEYQIQPVSRSGMLCGVAALIGLAGCDPCTPNPCGDKSFCNGEEKCMASGGFLPCRPGDPVICNDGEVCSEDLRACVEAECTTNEDSDDGESCVPLTTDPPCTAIGFAGVILIVTDKNGDTVTGAMITLTVKDVTETATTGRSGIYVGPDRSGLHTMVIEADGYAPVTIEAVVQEFDCLHNQVTLGVALTRL